MFGLISKKRIARIALGIYMNYDTAKSYYEKGDARIKDFYYRSGHSNALNALCHKIGINLTEDYVVPAKKQIHQKESIVRCKDCVHYQESDCLSPNKFCFRLKGKDGNPIGYNFTPDDYCSRGERVDVAMRKWRHKND